MMIHSISSLRSANCRRSALGFLTVLATLGCLVSPIVAQRIQVEKPQKVQIDWPAAARDVLALSPRLSDGSKDKALSTQRQIRAARRLNGYSIKDGMAPLARLNELVAERYPGVATVPIPVLAPIDTARLLTDGLEAGEGRRKANASYINELIGAMQFLPGQSGYDAVLTVSVSGLRNLGIAAEIEAQVLLAGTNLSYGTYDRGEIVADMQDLHPGLRRLLGSDEVTYIFRKYGAPYFVNIACSNGTPTPKELACTQADTIARSVLRGLRLIVADRCRSSHARQQPCAISPPSAPISSTSHLGRYCRARASKARAVQPAGMSMEITCSFRSRSLRCSPIRRCSCMAGIASVKNNLWARNRRTVTNYTYVSRTHPRCSSNSKVTGRTIHIRGAIITVNPGATAVR